MITNQKEKKIWDKCLRCWKKVEIYDRMWNKKRPYCKDCYIEYLKENRYFLQWQIAALEDVVNDKLDWTKWEQVVWMNYPF